MQPFSLWGCHSFPGFIERESKGLLSLGFKSKCFYPCFPPSLSQDAEGCGRVEPVWETESLFRSLLAFIPSRFLLTCVSQVAPVVKNPAASAGDPRKPRLIPGPGRSLEREMATHSIILAWEIPWTEEPGGLESLGSQRVGHDWACIHT